MPANTGEACAMYRVARFAGMPHKDPRRSGVVGISPDTLARIHPRLSVQAAEPGIYTHPCGSGHAREHRRSRCHVPRRTLRGHARFHKGP
ncbi:hypothetical protein D3C80_1847810 [compost metagenome]